MQTIHERAAGLDVHKAFIMCCVRKTITGRDVREEIRRFGTMTDDLLAMADWLQSHEVTHVAMESTAVLWKPVWNILEGYDFHLQLVNARELKAGAWS